MPIIKFFMPKGVPEDQIDKKFIQGMIDRMCVGFFNYGSMRRYEVKSHSLKNIKIRIKKYEQTKNTEFLMDAANYCMMEFVVPSFEKAFFKPTDKSESPGAIVDGKLVKGKEHYTKNQLERIEQAGLKDHKKIERRLYNREGD